jgi:hypothetical protein
VLVKTYFYLVTQGGRPDIMQGFGLRSEQTNLQYAG